VRACVGACVRAFIYNSENSFLKLNIKI